MSLTNLSPKALLRLLWIFTAFGLSGSLLGAADRPSIVMLPGDLDTEISDRVEIFPDKERRLTIADVSHPDFKGFVRNKQSAYSQGVFAGNLWLRFVLQADEALPDPLVLQAEKPLLEVHFFQPSENGFMEQKAGRMFTTEEEAIHSTFPAFKLIPPNVNETRTYYVMIRNDGVHSLSLSIRSSVDAWEHDRLQSWFAGAVTGAILIMIVYNFLLYLSTREIEFFWYTIAVFFIHFGYIAVTATNSNFYSGKIMVLAPIWLPLTKIIGTIALVQFSRVFLRSQKGPRWVEAILLGVMAISVLCFLGFLFLPTAIVNALYNLIVMIGLVTLISYSGYLFSQGKRYARFYFIAWFPLLLAAALQIAVTMLAKVHLLQYGPTLLILASIVEIILLSLALADKINVMREEKRLEEARSRAQQQEADRLHREEIMALNASLEIKVREQTADIRALLDHLPMAVMSVEQTGAIGDNVSAHTEQIIGRKPQKGESILQIAFDGSSLGSDQKSAMMSAISASVGPDDLSYVGNEFYLVREFVSERADGKRTFECVWAPIMTDDGSVKSLLLCIRDVTELEQLKDQAADAKLRGETMTEVLMAGPQKVERVLKTIGPAFHDFVNVSRTWLQETGVRASLELTKAAHAFFRVLHTEKAAARACRLKMLADQIHELEDIVSTLRSEQHPRIALDVFERNVRLFEKTFETYESVVTYIKSALGGEGTSASEARTVGQVVRDVIQALPEIAAMAEKPVPILQITAPTGLALNDEMPKQIEGMLLHLVRNAIDHSIESPDERVKRGKNPEGVLNIHMSMDRVRHVLTIRIKDDGAGFNSTIVSRKALEKGLPEASQLPADEIIFLPGFSSKETVTHLSGRGVGLDAVRAHAQNLGGNAKAVLGSMLPNGNQEIEFELTLAIA